MRCRVTKGSPSELTQSPNQNTDRRKPSGAGWRYIKYLHDVADVIDVCIDIDISTRNIHIARDARCDKCSGNRDARRGHA
jgi:hypothetical protein